MTGKKSFSRVVFLSFIRYTWVWLLSRHPKLSYEPRFAMVPKGNGVGGEDTRWHEHIWSCPTRMHPRAIYDEEVWHAQRTNSLSPG